MLNVLSPIADILVGLNFNVGGTQYDGAPCFNFYQPTHPKSLYEGLKSEASEAVTAATGGTETAVKKIQTAIEKVPFSIFE